MYKEELEQAWQVRRTNPDLAHKLIDNIKSTSDLMTYHQSLTIRGMLLIYENKYLSAEKLLLEAGRYFDSHEDYESSARNANALGVVYMFIGDLAKSVHYLLMGLEISRQHQITESRIFILYNLAEISSDIEKYDKALSFLHEAVEIDDGKHMISSVLYSSMARCYQNLENANQALYYITKSLDLVKDTKDLHSISLCEEILAQIYLSRKDYHQAMAYCNKSLSKRLKLKDSYSVAINYLTLARIYFHFKSYDFVLNYAEQALQITKSIDSLINDIDLYKLLATTCKLVKRFDESIYYHEKLNKAKEAHFSKQLEKNYAVLAAEQAIETIKKDAEIFRLSNIELKQKSDELTLISQVAQSIIKNLDLDHVISKVYESITGLIDAPYLAVGILDDYQLRYELIFYKGQKMAPYTVINNEASLGLKAIRERKLVYESDFSFDKNETERINNDHAFDNISSLIFCPLYNQDKAVGVISLQSEHKDAYSDREINLLKELSSYIAIAIDNANKTKLLNQTANKLSETILNLKETQDQLIKAERLAGMGRLVAGVAHELNTPIGTSITLLSHHLNEVQTLKTKFTQGILTKSQLEDFISKSSYTLDSIDKSITKASGMIQSFKTLAVQKENQSQSCIRIDDFYKLILVENKDLLKSNGVNIYFKANETEICIYRSLLIEVVNQLINNSLSHSFSETIDRKIMIAIEVDDKIVIHYKDNGQKISKDVQEVMYEPFYSTKKNLGFMGIGLHVVHNIITHILRGQISYHDGYTIELPKEETH